MNQGGDITICWEARDPARNMARAYRVSLSVDLFGCFVLERAWGRCGCQLKTKVQSFGFASDAQDEMLRLCSCREAAGRRIGVEYRRIENSGGDDLAL